MNYIKPKSEDNYLVVCEHCKAIINYSKDDLFCIKEADWAAFKDNKFENVRKVCITCPNCNWMQDVINGVKYMNWD